MKSVNVNDCWKNRILQRDFVNEHVMLNYSLET